MLNELEAFSDIALVARKEESSVLGGPPRGSFSSGDFGAILDPSANDTVGLSRNPNATEVVSRIRLAGVCREGAPFLRFWVIAEVVVAVWICAEGLIISKRGNINGGSCPHQHHISISVKPQNQEYRMTYRSSISQQAEHQEGPCPIQEAYLGQE